MSTEEIIAQAIDAAQPQAAATEAPAEAPEQEQTDLAELSKDAPKEEPDYKALVNKKDNAISYRDKKISKLNEKYEQAMAELNKLRTPVQNPQQAQVSAPVDKTGIPTKLDPNSFNNWADYSDARAVEIADYKIGQKFTEFEGKQKAAQHEYADQVRLTKSWEDIGVAADKLIAETPDAQEVFDQCEDTLIALPPVIKRVLLEAGVGAELAVYNLAKEGRLEALAYMPPLKAAMEVARAQAQPIIKPKPVTRAPAPISPSKGVATGGKTLDRMSWEEQREWLGRRE